MVRVYVPNGSGDPAEDNNRDMGAETPARISQPEVEWPRVDARPVLLVDDDPFILSVGALLLRRMGFTVLTAESAAEALDVMLDAPEGLRALVSDLWIGHASGVELIGTIRALCPTLPAVLMSGSDTLASAGPPSAVALAKPFTARDLALALVRADALAPVS